ncbi:hypothetical protein L6452_28115 [Arctium lappa]|uniref:Uncharacterized protein n=1 Tax=Arctium lappa TaxID=4217 RepID=A0ACB8ZYX4_ARCLA|nr:hypothetical protein L6452_28115 [Arctium lappa]
MFLLDFLRTIVEYLQCNDSLDRLRDHDNPMVVRLKENSLDKVTWMLGSDRKFSVTELKSIIDDKVANIVEYGEETGGRVKVYDVARGSNAATSSDGGTVFRDFATEDDDATEESITAHRASSSRSLSSRVWLIGGIISQQRWKKEFKSKARQVNNSKTSTNATSFRTNKLKRPTIGESLKSGAVKFSYELYKRPKIVITEAAKRKD